MRKSRLPLGLQTLRRELYDFDMLDERGVMTEVRIYTARYCPYCASARALLRRKGVVFAEIDIGGNWERRDEMIEMSNGRVTVPQIFVGPLHDRVPLSGGERTWRRLRAVSAFDPKRRCNDNTVTRVHRRLLLRRSSKAI